MHRQLNVKQIQLGGKDGGELVLGRGKAERERKRERIQTLDFFLREREFFGDRKNRERDREREKNRESVCVLVAEK